MRNLIRSCLALAMILSSTTLAYSQDLGTYMSGSLGVAMLADSDVTDTTFPGTTFEFEYELGYFAALAMGQNVGDFRGEVEIGMQKNAIDSVGIVGGGSTTVYDDLKLRLTTVLLNFYYDFNNSSAFTPYLSFGLGLGNMKLDSAGKDDAVAAYQLGAGVSYLIGDHVMLDLKIRHLETSDGEFDTTSVDYATNNAIFSVRYYF